MKMTSLAVTAALCAAAGTASAQQIWSGYDFSFTKLGFADPVLPVNQDRITSNVWITRGDAMGIYNAAQEPSFTGFGGSSPSPVDTEWSFGTTADWNTLTYQPWVQAIGQNPPGMVGQAMVVHLITDDIYLDIMFTAWGQSPGTGGSFSYRRAVPAPSALAILGLGGIATARRRR